jgi:hypothetical protein
MPSFSMPMKRAHRGGAHEIARAAARLQNSGIRRNAEPGQSVVHRRDDNGRSVIGVVRRRAGAVVFVGGEQAFQLVAQLLPASVLVGAGDGMREERQGDGSEAAEPGEDLPLVGAGRAAFPLDMLQGFDGGNDVAGLGLLAAGDGGRGDGRGGSFHGVGSFSGFRPRQPGPFGATRQAHAGHFAHRPHRAAGARRHCRNGSFTLWENMICESRFCGGGRRLRLYVRRRKATARGLGGRRIVRGRKGIGRGAPGGRRPEERQQGLAA